MDMVTVSCRLDGITPLVCRVFEAGLTVETGGVRTPTSSVLPLTEDISVLEWKEEMEELVSSVMDKKKGILSAWMVEGEGPLLWKVS